jgi:hypothetical protein
MKSRSRVRCGAAWILVTTISVVALSPWCLYVVGLAGVSGKPPAPRTLSTPQLQVVTWQRMRGVGNPELATLNPYTYLSATNRPGPQDPSHLLAWNVASNYVLKHHRFSGRLWWHLSSGALTIWLTRKRRHWAAFMRVWFVLAHYL